MKLYIDLDEACGNKFCMGTSILFCRDELKQFGCNEPGTLEIRTKKPKPEDHEKFYKVKLRNRDVLQWKTAGGMWSEFMDLTESFIMDNIMKGKGKRTIWIRSWSRY